MTRKVRGLLAGLTLFVALTSHARAQETVLHLPDEEGVAEDFGRPNRFGSGDASGALGLAQAATGTVSGAVTRAGDGAAVSGATVKALQAGILKATAPGYETQTRTGVNVSEQATTTADFSLEAPGITYVYDALGRLIAVIDPAGEVTRYEYDAVGNVQSVSR